MKKSFPNLGAPFNYIHEDDPVAYVLCGLYTMSVVVARLTVFHYDSQFSYPFDDRFPALIDLRRAHLDRYEIDRLSDILVYVQFTILTELVPIVIVLLTMVMSSSLLFVYPEPISTVIMLIVNMALYGLWIWTSVDMVVLGISTTLLVFV